MRFAYILPILSDNILMEDVKNRLCDNATNTTWSFGYIGKTNKKR